MFSSRKRAGGAPPSPGSSATVSATGRSGAKLVVARRSLAHRHCPSGACSSKNKGNQPWQLGLAHQVQSCYSSETPRWHSMQSNCRMQHSTPASR